LVNGNKTESSYRNSASSESPRERSALQNAPARLLSNTCQISGPVEWFTRAQLVPNALIFSGTYL